MNNQFLVDCCKNLGEPKSPNPLLYTSIHINSQSPTYLVICYNLVDILLNYTYTAIIFTRPVVL